MTLEMGWPRAFSTADMVRARLAGTSTIGLDAASVGPVMGTVMGTTAFVEGAMDSARAAGIGTAIVVCAGPISRGDTRDTTVDAGQRC